MIKSICKHYQYLYSVIAFGFSVDVYNVQFVWLVGLVVASVIAERGVLGLISGSGNVLLGFSIRNSLVTVTESGMVPG